MITPASEPRMKGSSALQIHPNVSAAPGGFEADPLDREHVVDFGSGLCKSTVGHRLTEEHRSTGEHKSIGEHKLIGEHRSTGVQKPTEEHKSTEGQRSAVGQRSLGSRGFVVGQRWFEGIGAVAQCPEWPQSLASDNSQ